MLTARVGKQTCEGGKGRRYRRPLISPCSHVHTGIYNTARVMRSFQEMAARKTEQHTIKHRDGGVGSVIANHCGGSKSSVVVTTLLQLLNLT